MERRAPTSYREPGVGLGEELRVGVGVGGGETAEKSQRPALKPDSTTKSRLSKLPPPHLSLPIR